ncbi:MAG: intermembrane phospholipid transport protein YdbH family protein, partial [Nitrospira sp.]
ADALDLQTVLDAANVDAARASGRVSGRIPVSFSRRGVAINQGTLASDEQGILTYRPAVPPAALQQEDGGIKLLRDALENFHYDRLTITLDGESGNEWNSMIHIAGKNPNLLDGQPLVLNANLTVMPGHASVELGARTLDVGDTLPVYNALFGLGFLEWLGNSLRAIGASMPSPHNR